MQSYFSRFTSPSPLRTPPSINAYQQSHNDFAAEPTNPGGHEHKKRAATKSSGISEIAVEKDKTGCYNNFTAPTVGPIISVVGIFIFFLAAGAAHEKLYAFDGVPDHGTGLPEKFVYSMFLVFVWCLSNCIVSMLLIVFFYGESLSVFMRSISCYVYKQLCIASCTYVISLLVSNYALTHVNYPTQILVKSAKTVPIVVGGYIQYRKKYPWYDYFAVVVVTCGLVLFNIDKVLSSGNISSKSNNTYLGLGLLGVALICDGMTGPRQDEVFKIEPQIRAITVMFIMNIFAMVLSFVAFIIFEHIDPFIYIYKNPESVVYMGSFAFASTAGQLFIFMALTLMGSLYLAVATTLRKFCSIVVSILLYKHNLSSKQWFSVISIFAALGIQTYFSQKHKRRLKEEVAKQLDKKDK